MIRNTTPDVHTTRHVVFPDHYLTHSPQQTITIACILIIPVVDQELQLYKESVRIQILSVIETVLTRTCW